MNKTIIFEGLDRCLKDTMIERIKTLLPAAHVLHYSKPPKNVNQEQYQRDSFFQMMKLIGFNAFFLPENKASLIINRSHIGEYVYAPIYRNYPGDYVYDLERRDPDLMNRIWLITLVDTNLDAYLKRDDGESFSNADPEKVREEIQRFTEATTKSHIKNKRLFDLNGYYDSADHINDEQLFHEIRQFVGI